MKKNKMRKLNKILEIPEEVYSDVPKISLIGFDEMIIENYKGILEYEEFFIRISTYKGLISINGYNLNLETMTNDDIRIHDYKENHQLHIWLFKNCSRRLLY